MNSLSKRMYLLDNMEDFSKNKMSCSRRMVASTIDQFKKSNIFSHRMVEYSRVIGLLRYHKVLSTIMHKELQIYATKVKQI